MENNNFLFKLSQGNKTALDKAYNKHLNIVLDSLDEEKKERWETYNLIIKQLIEDGKKDYIDEIKYRLTDGEDPNIILLDIIDRNIDEISGFIWFLRKRIEEYLEDDYLKRFYL